MRRGPQQCLLPEAVPSKELTSQGIYPVSVYITTNSHHMTEGGEGVGRGKGRGGVGKG